MIGFLIVVLTIVLWLLRISLHSLDAMLFVIEKANNLRLQATESALKNVNEELGEKYETAGKVEKVALKVSKVSMLLAVKSAILAVMLVIKVLRLLMVLGAFAEVLVTIIIIVLIVVIAASYTTVIDDSGIEAETTMRYETVVEEDVEAGGYYFEGQGSINYEASDGANIYHITYNI